MTDGASTAGIAEVFDESSMSSVKSLLTCEGVDVHFGGVVALSGFSLEVESKDIVGIVGPNGAGKSTLLNVVSGLLRERATGHVSLCGESILGMAPVAISRLG